MKRKPGPTEGQIAFARAEMAEVLPPPSEHCTTCGGSKYADKSAIPVCICTKPDWKVM
jgi:hypothetical protein